MDDLSDLLSSLNNLSVGTKLLQLQQIISINSINESLNRIRYGVNISSTGYQLLITLFDPIIKLLSNDDRMIISYMSPDLYNNINIITMDYITPSTILKALLQLILSNSINLALNRYDQDEVIVIQSYDILKAVHNNYDLYIFFDNFYIIDNDRKYKLTNFPINVLSIPESDIPILDGTEYINKLPPCVYEYGIFEGIESIIEALSVYSGSINNIGYLAINVAERTDRYNKLQYVEDWRLQFQIEVLTTILEYFITINDLSFNGLLNATLNNPYLIDISWDDIIKRTDPYYF